MYVPHVGRRRPRGHGRGADHSYRARGEERDEEGWDALQVVPDRVETAVESVEYLNKGVGLTITREHNALSALAPLSGKKNAQALSHALSLHNNTTRALITGVGPGICDCHPPPA